MKGITYKQRQRNAVLAKIKRELPEECAICGQRGCDLAHILPKSIYPEYYTDPRNLMILCRRCHRLFDDDRAFRAQQTAIRKRVEEFDPLAAHRHFSE